MMYLYVFIAIAIFISIVFYVSVKNAHEIKEQPIAEKPKKRYYKKRKKKKPTVAQNETVEKKPIGRPRKTVD